MTIFASAWHYGLNVIHGEDQCADFSDKRSVMTLSRLLLTSLLLCPLMACAHNFIVGEQMAPLTISERGELVLDKDNIRYRPWSSPQLAGKVRVLQYIAGRTSAKDKNALLIKAIKRAQFPDKQFQPTTIVNTDDEIPGSGFFVGRKVEKNKRKYPWAQFIIDSQGLGRKTWHLKPASSTILLLDKDGHIQWAKDGALTEQEVCQLLRSVHDLLTPSRAQPAPLPATP